MWIHDFRKALISGATLFGEVAWLNIFCSALCLRTLLLQLSVPISHLIRRSRSAVYLSLCAPSILRHGHSVKSLAKAMKSLRGFRKLSRRSTMTRPWREWRNNGSSKGKVGETAAAAMDQRIFTENASIANMAAKMENDRRESVRKLPQAHDISARTVHGVLRITWSSQRSRPRWAAKRFSFEMKERFRTCKAAEAIAAAVLWQF